MERPPRWSQRLPESSPSPSHGRFFTIDHSSRTIAEFVSALRSYGVTLVVDVMRFPGTRRNPQFGADALADALRGCGIEYRPLAALGGRRSRSEDPSPNGAWENSSFRGYADYALTDEFQRALEELIEYGRTHTPVILCAEAVYWRCHRRIVADCLLARVHEVVDVFGPKRAEEHELTTFAEVHDGRVVYPAEGA